jgi:hypothetical protein
VKLAEIKPHDIINFGMAKRYINEEITYYGVDIWCIWAPVIPFIKNNNHISKFQKILKTNQNVAVICTTNLQTIN